MRRHVFRLATTLVLVFAVSLPACTALQQVAALRDVKFALDSVAQVRLAGVDISNVRSYSDIGALDILRLTRAVSSRELPLDMVVNVAAENPESNSVTANMVQFDWTLLLDDRDTISGAFNEEVALRPGVPSTIGIPISLNLVEFFDRSLPDLINLALALGGQEGASSRVALRATPTINTPIGPIRYPNPIDVVSRDIGSN